MTGGTLGTHLDPALERARAAAERAITIRLEEAGWPTEVAEGLGRVAAEIATDAAWPIWKNTISAWQQQYRIDPDLLWDPHREETS